MIPKEPPIAGTVIRYSFLWSYENQSGLKEGRKDRPVVLVVAKDAENGNCIVVPITHREPESSAVGIEISEAARLRLGLDDARQWIIITEGNAFIWPGPDLGAIPGIDPPTFIYGRISKGLYVDVLARMQTLIKIRRISLTTRS